ncbi:peptidoglycan DD-metalloendopeptidase family protein [Shouchella rhizosphaerae]|uniref:peptidoglycan DD-metalloendopeptidase family protein n=1 Tax=Shouchella rhizosphaerae TaxID=866786 RepID=UPI003F7F241E
MKEEKNSSKKVDIQSFMRKRWVMPAAYLVVGAGLLSAVFFLQNGEDSADPEEMPVQEQENRQDEPTVPVNVGNETLHMPVANESDFEQVGFFYDPEADAQEQEQALVFYDNVYRQNKGIDLASKDQETFPVQAAMSGTVTKAMKDSVLGYVVEVDHGNGITTHYSSLEGIEAEQGTEISQGDVIGNAGSNVYDEEAGVHVHFEIRKDGVAMNPYDAFNKSLEDINDAFPLGEKDKKGKENEEPDENDKAKENEKDKAKENEKDGDSKKDKDENDKPAENKPNEIEE